MCQVLILDDEKFAADTVKLTIETQSNNSADVAYCLDEAIEKAATASGSGKPYDIFLIDQVLGPGKNGIEAMKELRRINPYSDAIIFTGFGDSETGLKAYRAGAFRYLPKGYDNQELLYLLESLNVWRDAQREHGWQKTFISMMETGLRLTEFREVAQTVAEHALQLGFQRVHLLWVPTLDDAAKATEKMLGICCCGENCIPEFNDKFFSLLELFQIEQTNLTREPVFYWHRNEEAQPLPSDFGGYEPPQGEWCLLPLWNETALLGALVLDYGPQVRSINAHERSLLSLYARQSSIVLHHVSLYNREKITSSEMNIINEIGRETNTSAANADLSGLLERIYQLIKNELSKKRFDDVLDFAFVLYDRDAHELDFRLRYEGGKKRESLRCPADEGLEGYLISQRREIFLPKKVRSFAKENGISLHGKKTPASWMGVPLMVSDEVIGCIAVQHYNDSKPLVERERRLLTSTANQVAGVINNSRLSEIEKKDMERLQVLQEASVHMMRITQEKEDEKLLWRILLTVVTANFGLGFNRALLLRTRENNTRLVGEMGIGTDDPHSATHDWERDEKRNYTFQKFLKEASTGKIYPTDYESLIAAVSIPLNGNCTALTDVLENGSQLILDDAELANRLPSEITTRFALGKCGVLPLRAGDRKLGVVIVDNKHNHRPLNPKSLNRLQTLLDNTGLVLETLNERKKSESLLKSNYEILGGSGHQSLPKTLSEICKTARMISEANWAIIIPIVPGRQPYEFDPESIGYDGDFTGNIQEFIRAQPQVRGISLHVIKKGELVIKDIDSDETILGQRKLSEHRFIKQQDIKALVGAVIRDPYTKEPIGLLYLDYRRKREFTKLEKHHARSFANLAAIAMLNLRNKGLEAALQTAEAISTATDLEKILETVLQKLQAFFKGTNLCVLLYQKDENALKFAPGTLKFYQTPHTRHKKQDTFKLSGGSIACRVAQNALKNRRIVLENVLDVHADPDYLAFNPAMGSELCVSLMGTKNDLLGVLVLERPKISGFSEDDQVLVRMVGQQISLALERAQQSEALDFKSSVAAQTAWAADIAHDIKNEVGNILTYAYLIKEVVDKDSPLLKFADQIENSALTLSSAGPWSSEPDQMIELDRYLDTHLPALAKQRGLSANLQLGAEGIWIKANLAEFDRVLKQLLRNADRAMSENSEKNHKMVEVTTRVEKNSSGVSILFRDSGPGVKEDIRDSIFQRSVTTKAKGRGGYGLLLTRQMVEDMHGEIKLLPFKAGQGAVFSIQLPIADPYDTNVE